MSRSAGAFVNMHQSDQVTVTVKTKGSDEYHVHYRRACYCPLPTTSEAL